MTAATLFGQIFCYPDNPPPLFFLLSLKEMPRFVTLFASLALATAVTYKYKESVLVEQKDIQKQLDNVKSTLDNAPAATRNCMSDSQKYLAERLMPSVKESWNSQITNVTHSVIEFDVGTKVKRDRKSVV